MTTPQLFFNNRIDPYDDLPPQYTTVNETPSSKPPPLTPSTSVTRSFSLTRTITDNRSIAENNTLPPTYHTLDPLPTHLTLSGPLIHATTTTSSTPYARYHLSQQLTKSGRPLTLSLRHLLPAESHRLATSPPHARELRYDSDTTLYHITRVEMRGLRAGTVSGSVQITTGIGVRGRWWRVWRAVRSRRDSLDPGNEARMNRYGYKPEEEWDREVVFYVRGGTWFEGESKEEVAVEMGEKGEVGLRLADRVGDAKRRDFVVACWVLRLWWEGKLRWSDAIK